MDGWRNRPAGLLSHQVMTQFLRGKNVPLHRTTVGGLWMFFFVFFLEKTLSRCKKMLQLNGHFEGHAEHSRVKHRADPPQEKKGHTRPQRYTKQTTHCNRNYKLRCARKWREEKMQNNYKAMRFYGEGVSGGFAPLIYTGRRVSS